MELNRRDFLKLLVAGGASAYFLRASGPIGLFEPKLAEKEIRSEQAVFFLMPDVVDGDFRTKGETHSEISYFEEAVGHKVQGLSFFADFDEHKPSARVIDSSFSSGRAIMFNLQPRTTDDPLDVAKNFKYKQFEAGLHLKILKEMAHMMASFKMPIFIRYGFEMNGDWFSWGGEPENYKLIWRHLVSLFRSEGANNVKWIFSPNYLPSPEKVGDYYPGDEFVDVVGPDIYDWEEVSSDYAVNRINYHLRAISSRPLMITELGADGLNQDEWVSSAIRRSLRQGASAVNYFQFTKEKDWKLRKGAVPKTHAIVTSGAFLNNNASLEDVHKTILTAN